MDPREGSKRFCIPGNGSSPQPRHCLPGVPRNTITVEVADAEIELRGNVTGLRRPPEPFHCLHRVCNSMNTVAICIAHPKIKHCAGVSSLRSPPEPVHGLL